MSGILRREKHRQTQVINVTLSRMQIVHTVREFGRTGGMEQYVWRLTSELAVNHDVSVFCEKVVGDPPDGVRVIRPTANSKNVQSFSTSVRVWRQGVPQDNVIIHSHQSLCASDVFTFHSTPFGWLDNKKWWKKISPKWWLTHRMYKNAMKSGVFQIIIPVSDILSEQIATLYPFSKKHIGPTIAPGVDFKTPIHRRSSGNAIGFAGREWKRKGLEHVIHIIEAMPDYELVVAGPPPDELQHLVDRVQGRIHVLGWIADMDTFFSKIDVLVHPAIEEAYGMVVAEAMARGIPVVVSDTTGAAQHAKQFGKVLPISASIQAWTNAINEAIFESRKGGNRFLRSWRNVSDEYYGVYETLTL